MTLTGRLRVLRLLLAVVVPLGLVSLTATGCASTQDQNQGSAQGQLSPPTPSASASSAVPPAPSAPSTLAPCRTAELKVSLGPGGVAAGTWAALLEFTNHGTAACSLTGWPAVAGIAASGTSAPATKRSGSMDGLNASGTPLVTLAPGGQAGIDISGTDNANGGGNCPPPYRQLRVSAPGDSSSVTVPAATSALSGGMPSCAGLGISPVHPLSDFSFSGQ